jgi:hypothetical protein
VSTPVETDVLNAHLFPSNAARVCFPSNAARVSAIRPVPPARATGTAEYVAAPRQQDLDGLPGMSHAAPGSERTSMRDIFSPGKRPSVRPGYVLELSILFAPSGTGYGSALVAMGDNRHENAMDTATC